MSVFKKGKLDKDTMDILSNGSRAHGGNDADLRAIKAEILSLKVGEYIDFPKRYLFSAREFAARHRQKNNDKKFATYKQGMSEGRIARIK